MFPACVVAAALVAAPTRYAGPVGADGLIDYEAAVNARLSAGVTPETNALVPLWLVIGPTPAGGNPLPAGYFKRLGAPCPPPDGDYFRDFGVIAKELTGDDEEARAALWREYAVALKRPWTAAAYPAVADWLVANAGPLDAARAAVARPDYYSPMAPAAARDGRPGALIGSLLPHLHAGRSLVPALAARALLRAGSGDVPGARADLLAGFRLARHVGSGGTMIEVLTGVAAHESVATAALGFAAEAKLTSAELAAFRREFDALPPLPDAARRVDVAERAVLLDVLNDDRRRGPDALARAGLRPSPALWQALDWRPVDAKANEFIDRGVALMRTPDRAARRLAADRFWADAHALTATPAARRWADVQAAVGLPGPAYVRVAGGAAVRSYLLGFDRVQSRHDQGTQARRNVRVALALAAYNLDRGEYPADLAALVPYYLPAVPPDVLTGRPPAYTRTSGGYELRPAIPLEDAGKPAGPHTGVTVPLTADDGK